jgi:hypothetical protein
MLSLFRNLEDRQPEEKTRRRPSPFLCYHVAKDGLVAFPRVDDHLVEPETTRDEVIGGRRIVASPAQPPHARRYGVLEYVVQAHVRPGYTAAVDLLTRVDEESDSPPIPASKETERTRRLEHVTWRRSPSRWSRSRTKSWSGRKPDGCTAEACGGFSRSGRRASCTVSGGFGPRCSAAGVTEIPHKEEISWQDPWKEPWRS